MEKWIGRGLTVYGQLTFMGLLSRAEAEYLSIFGNV